MGTVIAVRGEQELILDGRGEDGWSLAHIREGDTDYPSQKFVTLFALGGWSTPSTAETAAGERRVRTPEGVEKYDQPIGSVIVKDREVKAVVTPKTVKWRDLKVGDRFIDAIGHTLEVYSKEEYDREAEQRAIRDFYRDHWVEMAGDLLKVPRPPKASGKVMAPLDAFKYLVARDPALSQRVYDAWRSQYRKITSLDHDTGYLSVGDGVSNPEHEFERAPTPKDPFEGDVLTPTRDALRALHEKYPEGVEVALQEALHETPPEPKISEEMNRLWREGVANYEMVQIPAAEKEVEDAKQVLNDTGWVWGIENPRDVDAAFIKAGDRLEAAERRLRELQPENVGGDVQRYYVLLEEHRAEYAKWSREKKDLTPRSARAQEILADIEEVGAVAREGIELAVARDPRTPARDTRRRMARHLVSQLRGTTTSTTQTWLTDFDMTYPGAQRGLNEAEKAMLTDSLLVFPKTWVEGFDARLGRITTDKNRRGYFRTTQRARGNQYHISLSDPTNSLPYDGSPMMTTAVHEVGHGMERVIMGLTDLELVFWANRVGYEPDLTTVQPFDSYHEPHMAAHPTAERYSLKWYGETSPSGAGLRRVRMREVPDSFEVFTTGVQEVLGNGETVFSVREGRYSDNRKDTELWDLTMGALLTLPGTPGEPHGTMGVEEVQTMTSPMITDQELITAAHPTTKSKRQYRALYSKGGDVTFAVDSAETAKRYAREYGIRFLGGQSPVSVRWAREEM